MLTRLFHRATMVTATLPCLTDESDSSTEQPTLIPSHNARDSVALSVESEATITPELFQRTASRSSEEAEAEAARDKTSILAGYVGLFTGLGALVSLLVFLPLPSQFSKIEGVEIGEALQYAYYVVGAISILVASFVYIGLRKLKGEEGKGFRTLFGLKKRTQADGSEAPKRAFLPYRQLLRDAIILGVTDAYIGLGYLGGFVARASTVAISAFIPLFVKIFFVTRVPGGDDIANQRKAYVLASILTGVAQLCALIAAPVFGYLARRRGRWNYPIVVTAVCGIVGYSAFPNLASPEVRNVDGRGGSPAVFLLVALIGISQIGAIVCSLGSLGKGVLEADPHRNGVVPATSSHPTNDGELDGEDAPLLESHGVTKQPKCTRVLLKGTIAGVYSWCGGAAILLLTKLGGWLFDRSSHGAPFYMMAVFNAALLLAALGVDVVRMGRARRGKNV